MQRQETGRPPTRPGAAEPEYVLWTHIGAVGDLERSALLDVLADSPIGSIVRAKRANVESGRYPSTFKVSLALKDLRLVNEVAERAGRHLGVAAASRAWFERAAVAGAGDLDFSAMIATITGDGGAGAP